MILNTFKSFKDFELLDSGKGYRLERWGEVILERPDPQIIWDRSLSNDEWNKSWAIFNSASGEDKGKWEIKKALPKPWVIEFNNIKLLLKLSPFKHTGLFAEQSANWEWMLSKLSELKVESGINAVPSLSRDPSDALGMTPKASPDNFKLAKRFNILNLFAYTGGATMALAKAGCQVTHVDASKPAITWANENHALNKLPKDSVRWILDDCAKFVKRELKRGAKYDGIIMDPPAFGHSPDGKTWRFNNDLPGLLTDAVQLLSDDAKFLIINGYATNSSALALNNLLEDSLKRKPELKGKVEFGELCLKQKNERMLSTGIFAHWSK